MKNILIFTGAGISAESGLSTFRDSNGMWNNFDINEVCSVTAITNNFPKVLEFYNARRADAAKAHPNSAHLLIHELEKQHNVTIITQNVDDLHERAGSKDVIHLHGEIFKSRDMITNEIYDCATTINVGDLSPNNNQLRPHIVLFGEDVPAMNTVVDRCKGIMYDYIIVIGSTLQVYPAANIASICPNAKLIVVDPARPKYHRDFDWFAGPATEQLPIVLEYIK
jgi:NAD-dependent deacetylase